MWIKFDNGLLNPDTGSYIKISNFDNILKISYMSEQENTVLNEKFSTEKECKARFDELTALLIPKCHQCVNCGLKF